MSPPVTDFENEISDLLDELAGVQAELLALLDEKRRALTTTNLALLAELQPREERLAERLGACHTRRADLLAAADREGFPSESVAKLANKTSYGRANKLGG